MPSFSEKSLCRVGKSCLKKLTEIALGDMVETTSGCLVGERMGSAVDVDTSGE